MRLKLLVPLLASVTACTTVEDDPQCSGGKCDVDQSCDDPQYGDGTCQPSLACGVPDIDCFTTFDTDDAAGAWFAEFEKKYAASQQRAPRTLVPTTDPRHAKVRELLDRGWEAFRKHRAVGELSDKRPALVLINDPVVNAFVIGDTDNQKSVFAVHVQTGLIDANAPDEANLGVMMHELQHAVGLHLIMDNGAKMRRFYFAPQNLPEPIGREQEAESRATAAGVAWRAAAETGGPFSNAELGGYPFGGDLESMFNLVAASGAQQNPQACAHAIGLADALTTDIQKATDKLDMSLQIDLATLQSRVNATLTALKTECLAGFTKSFFEVAAFIGGGTPEQIEMNMAQHDRDLVTGKHIVDAIAALIADRRAAMRAAEAMFTMKTGRPWSALRYFSFEEDADDVSVTVLRAAKLDPGGNATFLLSAIPNERARCEQIINDGDVPPYGVDLGDEHHATCWRVGHIEQLVKQGSTAARTTTSVPRTESSTLQLTIPARLPLPHDYSKDIAY
jgi:hypothetical protein